MPAALGAEMALMEILLPVPVPQALIGNTEMIPPKLPKFTPMEVVPWPLVIVASEGTAQV